MQVEELAVPSAGSMLRLVHLAAGFVLFTHWVMACSSPNSESGGQGGAATSGGSSGAAGEASSHGGSAPSHGGTTLVINIGGADTGGDSGIGEECARTTTHAELIPANLLFVLDTSGSMTCNPPDGDAELGARCARFPQQEDPKRPTKWEVTSNALRSALNGMKGRPNLSVGLTLFPNGSECGVAMRPDVPIAPLDDAQLEAAEQALLSVKPTGETPIAGATILSFAHLATELRAARLTGNSFVILLTDGAETCAPMALTQLRDKDLPNSRLFDIRTFVIGAPGSESARQLLSQMAWEGGTASSEECEHASSDVSVGDCHFDMTSTDDFEAELGRALERITAIEEVSCVLDVPKNPDGGDVDLERVNVTFTPSEGEPVRIQNDLRKACAEGADGWQYSADRRQIFLCGEACTQVRSEPGELSVVLGCPTEILR